MLSNAENRIWFIFTLHFLWTRKYISKPSFEPTPTRRVPLGAAGPGFGFPTSSLRAPVTCGYVFEKLHAAKVDHWTVATSSTKTSCSILLQRHSSSTVFTFCTAVSKGSGEAASVALCSVVLYSVMTSEGCTAKCWVEKIIFGTPNFSSGDVFPAGLLVKFCAFLIKENSCSWDDVKDE